MGYHLELNYASSWESNHNSLTKANHGRITTSNHELLVKVIYLLHLLSGISTKAKNEAPFQKVLEIMSSSWCQIVAQK
jgi:hypothetical protein